MIQSLEFTKDLTQTTDGQGIDLSFRLPDPDDPQIPEDEFLKQITTAWQVCDRFDLQTEIWRGRILRTVRDREKASETRGIGFLNWLKEHEITKSRAYSWIELADSADALLAEQNIEADVVNRFSKRAFIETAQTAPEVQQMVVDAARNGDQITRRDVRQLTDEWTAMTSELLPEVVREKAAENVLPPRFLAPLVKEMQKLPPSHQQELQAAIAENPEVDTLKQVTTEARYLAKYLEAATQVQALSQAEILNLEVALEESLRVGCLNSTAELVNQAAQLEQLIAKLHLTWKRVNSLSDRLYVDTGASTPQLRLLLSSLSQLSGDVLSVEIGGLQSHSRPRVVRLQVLPDEEIAVSEKAIEEHQLTPLDPPF
jgi:hypothetical protein